MPPPSHSPPPSFLYSSNPPSPLITSSLNLSKCRILINVGFLINWNFHDAVWVYFLSSISQFHQFIITIRCFLIVYYDMTSSREKLRKIIKYKCWRYFSRTLSTAVGFKVKSPSFWTRAIYPDLTYPEPAI